MTNVSSWKVLPNAIFSSVETDIPNVEPKTVFSIFLKASISRRELDAVQN